MRKSCNKTCKPSKWMRIEQEKKKVLFKEKKTIFRNLSRNKIRQRSKNKENHRNKLSFAHTSSCRVAIMCCCYKSNNSSIGWLKERNIT